jgi:hypothetical protein
VPPDASQLSRHDLSEEGRSLAYWLYDATCGIGGHERYLRDREQCVIDEARRRLRGAAVTAALMEMVQFHLERQTDPDIVRAKLRLYSVRRAMDLIKPTRETLR